jgi:hypothetical protein
MRGKILNGKVVIEGGNTGGVGRVGRVGRDFPFFKLNLGSSNIILNKKKTLPSLPSLPAIPQKIHFDGPNLDEWCRINIPAWQRILKESIEAGDKSREKYARWMLSEVLKVEVNQ